MLELSFDAQLLPEQMEKEKQRNKSVQGLKKQTQRRRMGERWEQGMMGALLSVVDSKGTFYGGHITSLYGNRYNLFKAGLNPNYMPNKPMTRHK
ncbi:hypothetical protein LDENG_00056110 [Lucifuga dentata]|nr:hypothetical protein LDENG_00056110 [Lucifuga dentata]